jgi:glycosyltransferase domain-containing protein
MNLSMTWGKLCLKNHKVLDPKFLYKSCILAEMEQPGVSMDKSLTLVIATKNRPQNLAAVLKYYESTKFVYRILIADESDLKFKKLNLETLKSVTNLHIKYYDSGFKGIFDSYLFLLANVDSDYVINSGDDDFFNIQTINKCIDFLSTHPEYVSAGGISIRILGLWDKKKNKYTIYKKLNATTDNYISNSITSRLFNYSQRQKVITYNVVRTKSILKLYKEGRKYDFFSNSFVIEMYQNAMLLAEGKNKRFFSFYHFWFMPKGGREFYLKTNKSSLDSWFDKFNDPKQTEILLNFVKVVSNKLYQMYTLKKKISKDLAEMLLVSYISKFYSRRYIESSIMFHNNLSTSGVRNKVYLFHLTLFNILQHTASIIQAFIARNVFAELYIAIYCKTFIFFGMLKMNDSIKILGFLNKEKSITEKKVSEICIKVR